MERGGRCGSDRWHLRWPNSVRPRPAVARSGRPDAGRRGGRRRRPSTGCSPHVCCAATVVAATSRSRTAGWWGPTGMVRSPRDSPECCGHRPNWWRWFHACSTRAATAPNDSSASHAAGGGVTTDTASSSEDRRLHFRPVFLPDDAASLQLRAAFLHAATSTRPSQRPGTRIPTGGSLSTPHILPVRVPEPGTVRPEGKNIIDQFIRAASAPTRDGVARRRG